ncbi:MAG: purine-binding chemotaxis protein CheW [Desulfobacter sp.]|nr:MAG: purine-binding chemotaxis protein CheW [Desulfobacter sp.]
MTNNSSRALGREIEFSTFRVGGALFGINLLKIQEINKHLEVTKVPQAQDNIKGILNLRGRIVTIIDLGRKLALEPVKTSSENRNVIVNSQNEYIGLRVDSIEGVISAGQTEIEPAPANVNGVKGQFLEGVLKTDTQLIGILDIDKIL